MWSNLISMLQDANTQWVLFGTLLLGLASGVLGSFAFLRKQSLIGDAMAHAALPGVCIAFLFYGDKSMPLFLIGAAISGLAATYCIQAIVKYSRIKEDTSIGLVLSVFFGIGIVLLTRISQSKSGNKSGLDDFIFGQAASLVGTDVKVISSVAFLLLIITALLFKELKLLTFDPQFGHGIGLPTKTLNTLLMSLIVGAVVIGIQAVGVVLMAAMLITPAISARYWIERLDRMVLIAGIIGAASGILGTLISTIAHGLATGPLIVLAATIIFILSMLFAPRRGLFMKGIRQYKLRKSLAREYILQTLYELTEEKQKIYKHEQYWFTINDIISKRPISSFMLIRLIKILQKEKLVQHNPDQTLSLTPSGLQTAYNITLNNRLREMYVMHEMKFAHLNLGYDQRHDIQNFPNHVIHELKQLLLLHGRELMIAPYGKPDEFNKNLKQESRT